MVNVDCPGCGASYSVAEKRIPDKGMKMRCPKCGESFAVNKPSGGASPVMKQGTIMGVGGEGARGSDRNLPNVGAPTPPPFKKPLFSPSRPIPTVGTPDTDDVDAGFGMPDSDDVDDGFGMIDLALPGESAEGGDDLPTAAVDNDLPAVAEHADLPAPAGRPAPPRRGPPRPRPPRPAPPRSAPRLSPPAPMPAAEEAGEFPDLDMGLEDFGSVDADLPVAAADNLPVARGAGGVDLPSPRVASEADLPMPVEDNLPIPADNNLPMPADNNLPMPADNNLPMPADNNLPSPAENNLPLPADMNLPSPAESNLPIPADQDFPLPSAHGDLPMPGDFNLPNAAGTSADDLLPMMDDDLLPPAAMDAFDDMPPPPADLEYDALPSEPPDSSPREDASFLDAGIFPSEPPPAPEAFDLDTDLVSEPPRPSDGGIPIAPPQKEGGAEGVGDEFAIEEAGFHDEAAAAPLVTADDKAPRVRIKKKRGKNLRIALVAIPVLVLAAGVVPLLMGKGPFFFNDIQDALNASEYETSFATFRQSAQEQLEADTAAEARAVRDRGRSEAEQMPRYAPMTSYVAYLAFLNAIRFGDGASKASGGQLLSQLEEGSSGDMRDLALAAQAAASGGHGDARSKLNALNQRMKGDVDALVLAGYVELDAGDAKAAQAAFKEAVAAKKSARTLYGLARAQLKGGKRDEALKNAEAVLKMSKQHAGARALIALVLWQKDPRSERAVKLLDEVLSDGPVKQAASKEELVTAYSVLGTVYISQSHLGKAEKVFKQALKLDPQSALALSGSGELFYTSGRFQEALAKFEAAYRVDNQDVYAAVGMAKSRLALEQAKGALAQLKPLLKKMKHPLVGFWLGQAYEAVGNREQAEKTYGEAIKLGAANPDGVVHAYVGLASLLSSRGDDEDAQKVLDAAGEKLPDSAELSYAKGQVALTSGRFEDAKKEFKEAVRLDDRNLKSVFGIAIAHRRLREFDESRKAFDTVGKVDAEYPGLALERGLLFQETGETDKALKMYQDALNRAPNDVDLKLRVGSTQVVSGHAKLALPILQEVYKQRPRSADVNHYLGRAIMETKGAQEALRYLEAAAQLDPNRAEYHLYVGWASNLAGQPGSAEEAIEKALKLDRNMGDAFWQRAVVRFTRGQTLDALEDLELALEKNPSRWEAYATMAACHTDQNNKAAAEEAWRKAIDGNNSVAEWHYRLAKLMIDRGDKAGATPHLIEAVKLASEKDKTPNWMWNVQFLLGEAVMGSDPARAVVAFKEFLRLTGPENAYRKDAERYIEQLDTKKR